MFGVNTKKKSCLVAFSLSFLYLSLLPRLFSVVASCSGGLRWEYGGDGEDLAFGAGEQEVCRPPATIETAGKSAAGVRTLRKRNGGS